MILENILESGLFYLFEKLHGLDIYYASKGKSDQSSDLDGRVRLGDNMSVVLDQVSISLEFKNATVFDIYTFKKMSPYVNFYKEKIDDSVFGNSINISYYPDIMHYIKETKGVIESIATPTLKNTFLPIGLYKYDGVIHFRGMNILPLFNGFLEKFIYSNVKFEGNLISKESVENIFQTIYKNFIDSFLNISYKNSFKSSLIEDYIIHKDIYSYVPISYVENGVTSLYKIQYPGGNVNFFGVTNKDMLLSQIHQCKEYCKSNVNLYTNFYFYFGCSTSIADFMNLYNNQDVRSHYEIIDHQSFDIIFSDTNYRFHIPRELEKTHGGRINLMLNHNTECRNLIMSDNKITNSNHPSNKYGLIISGQRIKFVLRVSLNDVRCLYKFKNTINEPILHQIKELTKSVWTGIVEQDFIE